MRAKLGPEFWECITLRAVPSVKTKAIISNNALHKTWLKKQGDHL
jgi:hypothetical protein